MDAGAGEEDQAMSSTQIRTPAASNAGWLRSIRSAARTIGLVACMVAVAPVVAVVAMMSEDRTHD